MWGWDEDFSPTEDGKMGIGTGIFLQAGKWEWGRVNFRPVPIPIPIPTRGFISVPIPISIAIRDRNFSQCGTRT